jgi:hypothetical protein
MTQIGILEWQNEQALSSYPMVTSFGYDALFVDANFIQFDNFIPVLKKIYVTSENVVIDILIDTGLLSVTIVNSFFTNPGLVKKIYSNNRYIGKLVFGRYAIELAENIGFSLTLNNPFLPCLVKSIPSKCGVYTINGLYGNLTFNHDSVVYYGITGNDITVNAVDTGSTSSILFLKSINSILPIANNIYLKDTDTVKITTEGTNIIKISQVGTGVNDLTAPKAIIPTAL